MCPSCNGAVAKIEDEFICQQACGFRSKSSDRKSWIVLSSVIKLYQTAINLCQQYDSACGTSTIIQDFTRYIERTL